MQHFIPFTAHQAPFTSHRVLLGQALAQALRDADSKGLFVNLINAGSWGGVTVGKGLSEWFKWNMRNMWVDRTVITGHKESDLSWSHAWISDAFTSSFSSTVLVCSVLHDNVFCFESGGWLQKMPNRALFSRYITQDISTSLYLPTAVVLVKERLPSGGWCLQWWLLILKYLLSCVSIGQTSPVKSLKPVSRNTSFSSLLSVSLGEHILQFNFKNVFVLQLNY